MNKEKVEQFADTPLVKLLSFVFLSVLISLSQFLQTTELQQVKDMVTENRFIAKEVSENISSSKTIDNLITQIRRANPDCFIRQTQPRIKIPSRYYFQAVCAADTVTIVVETSNLMILSRNNIE